MDLRLELLREGYARDVIDLDDFERFVGHILEGRTVILPADVVALRPPGPPNAYSIASVLKAAWTEDLIPPPDAPFEY
jgi:hypothetical protein